MSKDDEREQLLEKSTNIKSGIRKRSGRRTSDRVRFSELQKDDDISSSFEKDLECDKYDEDETGGDVTDKSGPKFHRKKMIYLARKIKQDSLFVRIIEAIIVIGTVSFAIYMYCYFDNVHYHITHGYAKLGYSAAQHQIGQRYLHGAGVEKDQWTAMHWFKKAADQGHPFSSYNVAVGHLQANKTRDAHRLIKHAAQNGVKEAHGAMKDVCSQGGCK